jgi:hypothetical protein
VRIIAGMRWLSLFSTQIATVTGKNLLDTLCTHLSSLLSYAPGERDLVMLQHKFVVEWQDGNTVCHPHPILRTTSLIFDHRKH